MTQTYTAKRIATVQTGTRTIANTEFPVLDAVERVGEPRVKYWLVIYGLCNGIPQSSRRFTTRREALAELAERDA